MAIYWFLCVNLFLSPSQFRNVLVTLLCHASASSCVTFVTMLHTRFITLFLFVSLSVIVFTGLTTISISSERKLQQHNEATGSNTFTCLFNGKVWQQEQVQAELSQDGDTFYLSLWMGGDFSDRIAFVMDQPVVAPGVYELNDPFSRYILIRRQDSACVFSSDDYFNGLLIVNVFDAGKNLIAGSFEFMAYSESCNKTIRVNQGQFDLTYRQSN